MLSLSDPRALARRLTAPFVASGLLAVTSAATAQIATRTDPHARFAAGVGMVGVGPGNEVCLATPRRDIAPGASLLLVWVPVVGEQDRPEILQGTIGRTASCGPSNRLGFTEYGDTTYQVLLPRRIEGPAFYFGVLAAAQLVRPSGLAVHATVDGSPIPAVFRLCTSNEGAHFTIWAGEPLRSARVWHRYVSLGFETEPRCQPADYEDRPTVTTPGAPALHYESAPVWPNTPVTDSTMTARLRQAAVQYRAYAPVPRVAQYDLGYPRDAAEYAALNGHGVLLVVAMSQDSAELPTSRVYHRSDAGRETTLDLLGVTCGRTREADLAPIFGPFRCDALYLIPVQLRSGGDLLLDFARNRSAFRLARFSAAPPGLVALPVAAPGPRPSAHVLGAFVRREYPSLSAPFN